MSYQRILSTSPEAVVNEQGQFNYGCYNTAFREVNLLDARRPYTIPLPKSAKNIQLREWQAFQLGNGEYFMMMAIYNAKKLALVQFIVYHIPSQQKFHYEKKVAPWQLQVANGLWNTHSSHTSSNFKLKAHNDLANGKIHLKVDIQNFGELPNIKGQFTGFHDNTQVQPMVVCMPFARNRGMYSHKCLMPMQGELHIDQQKTITFAPEKSSLIIDDHKGYYPFPTRYDWVTAFGHLTNGQRIGFNLTANQVLFPKTYNENGLWLDGHLYTLPPIEVKRPSGYQQDWCISDSYGMVDLVFTPVVHTAVDINALIFRSKYQGPYGFFEGFICKNNGEKVLIERLFGMGEDFYLRV